MLGGNLKFGGGVIPEGGLKWLIFGGVVAPSNLMGGVMIWCGSGDNKIYLLPEGSKVSSILFYKLVDV